jgi:hypothetical protein
MDSGVRNRKVVVQFPSHPDFVHVSLDMLAHNRTNSLHAGTKCRQKMLQEFLVKSTTIKCISGMFSHAKQTTTEFMSNRTMQIVY